jgi:DNA-binding response OmpR family regulator
LQFRLYYAIFSFIMQAGQKTVMIIEDEHESAELFAEMMRVGGYRVLKMYSGASALSTLAREKPDAVILDIMLPDVSGLEVLHGMRGEPALAGTPVIIVSAKAMPTDVKNGLEAGASLYLTKPVTFRDLKEAVDRLTRGS